MWIISLFSLGAFAVNQQYSRTPVMCFVGCRPGTHQANPYTCDCVPDRVVPVMCFAACRPGTHRVSSYTCDCAPDVYYAEI